MEISGNQILTQLNKRLKRLTIKLTSLKDYVKKVHLAGLFCIAISIMTWSVDIGDLFAPCPYCRIERSVIGILGVFMLLRSLHHWFLVYLSCGIGFLGANIASSQNFLRPARMSGGEFSLNDPIYFDTFILSGAALFIIIGQVWLIGLSTKARRRTAHNL